MERLVALLDIGAKLQHRTLISQKPMKLKARLSALLRKFHRINRTIHQVHGEIISYNRCWARYLSVIFCTLTIVVTYFAYMLLMVSSTKSAFEMTFFGFFGAVLSAMLFAITYECTVLVYLNCKLAKLQRKFCVHFQEMTFWRKDLFTRLKV